MTELSFPDAVAARCEQSVSDVTRILSEARVPHIGQLRFATSSSGDPSCLHWSEGGVAQR